MMININFSMQVEKRVAKTSNTHSSKPQDLIDSATLLLISLYFDRTADAAFVNFSRVVTLFPQKTHFVVKLNDGCKLGFFCLSALDWFFFLVTSAIYHTWMYSFLQYT